MSEAKHTPGPWRLQADPCRFDNLTTITGGQRMNAKPHAWPAYPLTVQVGGTATMNEAQANAALLAAAPELLEALKQCRLALEPYDDVKPRDWKTDREKLAFAHQAACAAIKKAEGGAA